MDIVKEPIINLFSTGKNQYIIPFFQRPYVWKIEDCENLYEDFIQTLETSNKNPLKEHFIGTVITKPNPASRASSAKFDLIDGQQRLTTFALAIKALANSVDTSQENAQHLYNNINNALSYIDSFGKQHFRIVHNRIDSSYFNKVMASDADTIFDEEEGRSKIIDNYRFFAKNFKSLSNFEIDEFNEVIQGKFSAISMVLDAHDDEQEIFDTINSLGVKLTTSELLKNFVFNNDYTKDLYKEFWEDVFESDEETIKFWNTKKTAGRVYRENIDVLLYCFLLIETQKDVSLEHLFKDYKSWLSIKSDKEKENFLKKLKSYAEVYTTFPTGTELNNLNFSDYEKRFFHVIENLNITTIFPLVLFIYDQEKNNQERLNCLQLLESYLVRRNIAKLTTKNYNNLFISIIKGLADREEKSVFESLKETVYGYKDETNRFPSDEDLETAFANNVLSNQHAKETLFTIALYQINTVLHDVTALSSNSFSVEHMMPKQWQANWNKVMTPEEKNIRNQKLLTLGNLTIITKNLNSKLRNSSWSIKRNVLQENSAIPLTTKYTSLDQWDEASIAQRATDLYDIAVKIWKK
ncbi:DUF262 domain-containing protein [Chryseobacterium sp.]|uniref:DUF262 domain-containing protein n=1 Tax=Chryseobacterium sp. TaxID=1871047 RepID=UPI0012A80EDA|nr:DUF262 domain-containing protein [Chryseobacterium sp.]QFG53541.1 DUF262 domain-containing protein [Chryseobacterium sp.]